MKIGLMGCEFSSPNKGCEALTYSFLSLLNNISNLDNNTIIYNFSGTELGFIPKEFSRFKFINVYPKLKDLRFKYLNALKKCDIIFDVTMGDSFSDIYSENFFKHLILHKRIAELLCGKYILLPQTYGPFYSNESEKSAYKVLKNATKIYCRDELSQKLLEDKFNIKDSFLTSDMAFILPYDKDKYIFDNNKKIRIGINVSGLLYKGGFIKDNQFDLTLDYKELIDKLLNKYSNNNKYEVHLIPHVIDENENAHDDDYKICKELNKKYNNTILAPKFNTPIEAKSYISNMNVFIGSRMHSTIAAFSSNVVTIPVSYSIKFEGLFNSLNYPFVINGKTDSTEKAFSKINEYIIDSTNLIKHQKKALNLIQEKNNDFIESINSIL